MEILSEEKINLKWNIFVVAETNPPNNNKCSRKETWERIRRRPSKLNSKGEKGETEVWIKRESVHTQTRENDCRCRNEAVDSSSGMDDSLPREKASRPDNLPLGN